MAILLNTRKPNYLMLLMSRKGKTRLTIPPNLFFFKEETQLNIASRATDARMNSLFVCLVAVNICFDPSRQR